MMANFDKNILGLQMGLQMGLQNSIKKGSILYRLLPKIMLNKPLFDR